ncbi:MAG TPA: HEAT repeat domain-containing protein [Phycisphaerae bacterium]|nr:HEAT repeat domain-containing protein [Phycisphaerae bacterium]
MAAIAIGATMWGALHRRRVEGATPGERIGSIRRLAEEKPRGAGQALAEEAVSAADPSVRHSALVALGRFVEPRHRAAVEQGTRDASPEVRAAAAATLGLYGDAPAADRLGEMATSDPELKVRIGAVRGLGRNKCSKATAWLVRSAEKENDDKVQFHALIELCEKFGTRYIGPEPSKAKDWKREATALVEFLKGNPKVQEAYHEASWPLELRPEYFRDEHERHSRDEHERHGGARAPGP